MRNWFLSDVINSSNPLQISENQRSYLVSGTYEVCSSLGSSFFRKLQVIGIDPLSGNLLVKETFSGSYPYRKVFILAPDGKPEKFKGQSFLRI